MQYSMPKTTTRRLAYDFPTFYSLTNGRFLDKKIDFGSLCKPNSSFPMIVIVDPAGRFDFVLITKSGGSQTVSPMVSDFFRAHRVQYSQYSMLS